MHLNIRRGLFRSWVVLSALWIVAAGVHSYEEFRFAFGMSEYSPEKVSFPTSQ